MPQEISLMTEDQVPDRADVARWYEQVMPLASDRVFAFTELLDSIAHCKVLGSAAWSVTQLDDGFRLNVGQVEAMTCRVVPPSTHDSDLGPPAANVYLRLLLAGEDCLHKLALPVDGVAEIQEMAYSTVGERHWCYGGRFEVGVDVVSTAARALVEGHVAALRANHHAFLNLACQTPTGKLRQKPNFARFHSEALCEYASAVVHGAPHLMAVTAGASVGDYEVSPLVRIRIEKAAADSGFELAASWSGTTATLRSVQFPESVSVRSVGGDAFAVSASNPAVLPQTGSARGFNVAGWAALYDILGKIAATARTLPDRVAQQFIQQTAKLPQSTEAERWVVQRVGQQLFRDALLDYWQGKCCVTGLAVEGLLRASHIKPWAKCDTPEQRLDVFNGLLLAPHVDALFDGGWISFADDGAVLVSPLLGEEAREALGVSVGWSVAGLSPAHLHYLAHHRQHEWKKV